MNRRIAANQAVPAHVIASRALVCPPVVVDWPIFADLDHTMTGHKCLPRSSESPP